MKSVLDRYLVNSLPELFDRFESELLSLKSDLEFLASNRKKNFLEAQSILLAQSFNQNIIEVVGSFILSEGFSAYSDRLYRIMDLAQGIADFIDEHFEDIFVEDYSLSPSAS